jgi:bla regulator protein BlaR1
MISAALQQLAIVSWMTTLAVLLVALVRAPLRGTLGARAAYGVWLAVPASALALALPRAGRPTAGGALGPDIFGWMGARMDAAVAAIHLSRPLAVAACLVWALGAACALACMVLRQRSFGRSLGTLVQSPDGTWRSRRVAEPMLVGALRPRVLVPLDFERRYDVEERELVLAHERAHLRRGDALVNALGAVWLCVFWFNPVMFWAMRLLRFDQDLACDAAVLAAAGRDRRGRYARALLKAQLESEAASSLPLACHWHSTHPLHRRIAALRRPVAGRMRHAIGILCVATLVGSITLTAHAVGLARQTSRPGASQAAPSIAAAPTVHASGKVCPLSRHRLSARR